jgi:hypothetical protein
MGAAGAGLGGGGSLGFAMPEMNLFGIKSRGEKVFIILDASAFMMTDEMGGIPAYTIIKSELVRILEGLNSTILFNIAVYGGGEYTLFPDLVSATPDNVAKVDAWLKPLNAVSKGMGDKDYGPRTLGSGGIRISGDFKVDPLKSTPGEWAKPTLLAMQQQADVVFVLTCRWGNLRYNTGKTTGLRESNWSESDQERLDKAIAKAKELFRKDNERRREKGQPPRVIPGGIPGMVRAYVPGTRFKPNSGGRPILANYTPEQLVEGFTNSRKKSKPEVLLKSGVGKKNKAEYSINVIHFVKENSGSAPDAKFKEFTGETNGKYKKVEGMVAIQSYVSDEDEG